jgi:RNA polymerase-binding transcription factor DksA
MALSLLENQDLQLEEVAAALHRFEIGTFGKCESCHREIDRERLKAIPYTRYCIACARQAENE